MLDLLFVVEDEKMLDVGALLFSIHDLLDFLVSFE